MDGRFTYNQDEDEKQVHKIPVFLTNRTAVLQSSSYDYDELIPFWSYSVPGFKYMKRRFPGWDGRKKLFKYGKLPSGLFLATRKEIEEKLKVRFQVTFNRIRPRASERNPLVSDREYQNACALAMVEAGKCGGLILSATASGKTYMTAIYGSMVRGPILFVVDQLDLLWQAKKEIQAALGEKIGFVGDSKFRPRRITIATVQTMHKRRRDPKFRNWTRDIEVVIVDEIHTQLNKRNFDVVANIQPRACFGLTATLQLSKKETRLRAWGLCGPVVFEFPVKRGMQENVLSKGVVIRCRVPNPISM